MSTVRIKWHKEELLMSRKVIGKDEANQIFASNLRKQLETRGLKQSDVADAIGVGQTTFNNWCTGVSSPRRDMLQKLADYLNIDYRVLLSDDSDSYYSDQYAREMAEFLYKNPDYKVLFDAAKDVKPEDINFVRQMIERLSDNDNEN